MPNVLQEKNFVNFNSFPKKCYLFSIICIEYNILWCTEKLYKSNVTYFVMTEEFETMLANIRFG